MVKIFRKESEFNSQEYFLVTYFLESKNSLREAAWNLAIGQSIGNPNNRSVWETEEMFMEHSCFILAEEDYLKSVKEGIVKIAFPLSNINLEEDGVSQILCHVAGGQVVTATVSSAPTTTGSVTFVTFTNASWTGSITARGALIYKAGANGAVCVLDFGNDKTSTNTFVVQMPADTSTSALIRLI
jgi:hypothetical protein